MSDFRACSAQSIFLQTEFLVQLLGCKKKKKEKKRRHCWSRWKRRSNSNEPSFPPSSKRVTHRNKAWSNTCFGAFPVCCSHDNGIICLASRAGSQWGESNADCSGFKTGAAAGELSEELFQGSKCKTEKKQTPVFVRQTQASVGRVSQRRGRRGQLWHKYTAKKTVTFHE